MKSRSRATNVLGMKLTIPYSAIHAQIQVVERHTLAEVVRVERSKDGFKSSTQTTRPCFDCREEGLRVGVAGARPWPTATWLLHAEVFGSRTKLTLPLCDTHFEELREKEKEIQDRGEEGEWMWGGVVDSESGPEHGTYAASGFEVSPPPIPSPPPDGPVSPTD